MKGAIQVRELKKSYGSHIVLKGLDFCFENLWYLILVFCAAVIVCGNKTRRLSL